MGIEIKYLICCDVCNPENKTAKEMDGRGVLECEGLGWLNPINPEQYAEEKGWLVKNGKYICVECQEND